MSKSREIILLLISRQEGKTFGLLTACCEICLKSPRSIVKFVFPQKGQAVTVINPTMEEILSDCPPDLRPRYKVGDSNWYFKNGSVIQLIGSDKGQSKSQRGGKTALCVIDEACYTTNLTRLVDSELWPTTKTTGANVVLSSTPDPENPDHEFLTRFVPAAEEAGNLHRFNFDDPDSDMTDEDREKTIAIYPGGRANPRFRAEYLCEVVRSSDTTVIPEFDEAAEAEIVKAVSRPRHFDIYTSSDWGGRDWTANLFAYYDFKNNSLVVEDELVFKQYQNSKLIADGFKGKLDTLYDGEKPYMSVCDTNNVILMNDINMSHGLNLIPTYKDNKYAQVNKLRLMVLNREIIIHPRCKILISHMKYAKWKNNNSSRYKALDRANDGSHYDCVDALIYLVRNVVAGKNPYPSPTYGSNTIVFRRPVTSKYDELAKSMSYTRRKNER